MTQNILYVGYVAPGQTCRDRMLALEDLGCDVEPFDTTPFLRSGPRVMRSVAHRFNIGPRIKRLNSALAALSGLGKRNSMVWIDKGKWIYPKTLLTLRKRFGGPVVYFTPDAQFKDNKSRHFRRSVPNYDVLITTKPFELEEYRKAGADRLLLTAQAYDEKRAAEARHRADLASDVSFIGHRQPHYERTAIHVAEEDVTFKVWGPRWSRSRRDFVQGSGLWETDYYDGLKSAKIGLGLLSKRIPETSTTRTFEIPAAGTMLLAERTPEHQRFFEEGSEAEFFEGPEELREKVRYYVRNESARGEISKAGKEKCELAGYGNRSRLRAALKFIKMDHEFADLRFSTKAVFE